MTRPRDTTDLPRHSTDGTTFVVDDGLVGREVASLLSARGATVERVTTVPTADAPPDHAVHVVESIDAAALDAVGLGDASTVLVLGTDDARNFLVAQLARTRFGADRVLARVNDPDCEQLYERLAVETVDTTGAIANTAVEQC